MYSLMLDRLPEKKGKAASQLSGRDYDEMAIFQADFINSLVPLDAQKLPSLRELLTQYLRRILDLQITNPDSNEDDVRAIMDNFFLEAVQLYLPFVEERKEVTYHSTLALPTGVTGKANQIFFLQGTSLPLLNVGQKAFTVNLVSKFVPEVAQTFTEVMGMWERITKCLHIYPEEFDGILTNGKEWILIRRYQKDDIFLNHHSPCVSAFRRVDNQITILSEDGVEAILKMLNHSFTVAKSLASDFQTLLSDNQPTKRTDDDTHSGGDDLSEDTESEGGRRKRPYDEESSRKKSKAMRSSTHSSPTSRRQKTSTQGAKLSNETLALHLRNPDNTYDNRSLQRFIIEAIYNV